MKYLKIANVMIGLLIILNLFSCASTSNEKLIDATWTSMRHATPPTSKDKLSKVGSVYEEYCYDMWKSGDVGLMDEAVKKAESRLNIDFIKYPSFMYSKDKGCVQVSGEGYRLN